MTKWWENYEKTELTWEEWKKKAKELRSKNKTKEHIFNEIGVPLKDGEVIKVTSDGAVGYVDLFWLYNHQHHHLLL